MTQRTPLSRERIIGAAASVADRAGVTAVSMRSVAKVIGVEAMSLYHHVPSKEALLDDLADWVFERIELPEVGDTWREALTARARSARSVLRAHPWALGMMESRPTPGPALLQHHDRLLGVLMTDGFSATLATHAFSAIDAYVYGFALTETSLPFEPGDGAEEAFAVTVAAPAELYPHIARAQAELFGDGGFAFADEFDYGLDLLLESLERRVADAGPARRLNPVKVFMRERSDWLPADMHQEMAVSLVWEERAQVALQENLAPEVIALLVHDAEATVRHMLYNLHRDIPSDLLEAVLDRHPEDAPMIAFQINAPLTALRLKPFNFASPTDIDRYLTGTGADTDRSHAFRSIPKTAENAFLTLDALMQTISR